MMGPGCCQMWPASRGGLWCAIGFLGVAVFMWPITEMNAGEPTPEAETLSGAIVLDHIIAVVNGQPIPRSQVLFFRAYLELVGPEGLDWPQPIPAIKMLTEQDLLELVITDTLLYQGGSRIEALRTREKALQSRIRWFRGSFSDEASYQEFSKEYELTDDALREFFSRRLRVDAYIELKVVAGRPLESDLRTYHRAHPSQFDGQTFESAREAIVRALYIERAAERFSRWVLALRERARIIYPQLRKP